MAQCFRIGPCLGSYVINELQTAESWNWEHKLILGNFGTQDWNIWWLSQRIAAQMYWTPTGFPQSCYKKLQCHAEQNRPELQISLLVQSWDLILRNMSKNMWFSHSSCNHYGPFTAMCKMFLVKIAECLDPWCHIIQTL